MACAAHRFHARARIDGEGRLSVGRSRNEAKAAAGLPRPRRMTGCVAPGVPLEPRRHDDGRVLLEQGDKAVQIMAFPSLQVAAEELFLRGIGPRSPPAVGHPDSAWTASRAPAAGRC